MITLSVIVRDADGDEYQGGIRVDDSVTITGQTALDALIGGIQGVTVASVTGYILSSYAQISSPQSPGTGAYSAAQDRLDLKYLCADGSALRVSVPAPDESVFLADAASVDTSNAAVIALSEAVAAYVISSGGSPVVSLVSGKRHRVEYVKP